MARHTLYSRPNYSPYHTHVCGCYIYHPEEERRTYLPQVKLDAHTTILSTASRTVVTQSFVNSSKESLDEIRYAFPLYDGVSVVDFYCQVGERKIYGLVKEKGQAKKTYEEAKERGESAALLEQLPDAADVFTTAISNIPAGVSVYVTVKYVQELKHDAEVDGVRLTIPTSIAPRYGDYPGELQKTNTEIDSKGMSITVDVSMAEGVPVKKIISPSHPIQVALGSLSNSPADEDPSLSRGSASLALDTAELEKDFVLQVVVKDVGIPQAILETHPTLPNQRALMTTLVPKFNIKSQKPEIILIADRSGSMGGQIPTLKSALNVFLKSIPLGCTFNICSFGSRYEFLWPKSKIYEESTLEEAIAHVKTFEANFGGTETLKALKACFAARTTDSPTELILLTDGDIWSQEQLFKTVSRETKSGNVRVFALGIGSGVSSSLIEGVARAGRGFAQMVADNEKLDGKIVRMLKGALTPHVNDYRLEVKYEDDSVESVAESLRVRLNISDSSDSTKDKEATETKPISLYDPDAKEEHPKEGDSNDLFAGLPELKRPTLLQTPHEIPALFPFHRTCVYLLMAPESSHLNPKSVILKGTSSQGPLQIEIPVQQRKDPDEMIHQLAARKATQELEDGHGWISDATSEDTGALIKEKYPTQYELLQRREAVRLGVEFQVGGKYCSFVAVEANEAEIAERKQKAISSTLDRSANQAEEEDWEVIPEPAQPIPRKGTKAPRRTLASKACRKSAPSTGGLAVKKKPRKRVSTSTRDPWTTKKKKRKVANKDSGSAPRNLPMSNSLLMMSAPSASVGGGRGGATAGMGRGGAMRHRMTGDAILCSAYLTEESVKVEEKEEDEDEDMGFGLYDEDLGIEAPAGFSPVSPHYSGGSPGSVVNAVPSSAPSPGYSPTSPASPPSKKQKVVPEEQEEEDDGHDDNHDEVKPEGPLLNRLIAHQSFAGSWSPLSSIPFSELQVDASAVGNVVKKFAADSKIAGSARDAEQIVATAVVVLFLERKMASEEETWELVVEKARSWLEDKVTDGEGLEEVWKVAGELVGA